MEGSTIRIKIRQRSRQKPRELTVFNFQQTTRKTVQRLSSLIRKLLSINVPFFNFVSFCTVLLSRSTRDPRALLVSIQAEHESSANRR
jgi:hypothetical protein